MRRTRLRCAGIDIKTGLTNLAASNLRETPGALPVISRAAHYAGEGYSFMDTMLTLGPRAALGFLRTRASAYMVFCTAAFLGVSYFMTTDRVRLRSSELIVPLRMKSQSADQSVVKRNRITGVETVIEAVDGPHGETVYFRAHVNRLFYTYHVYKPKKEEYLLIDIGGELAADRFCDVEHKRGRVHEERALSEAMARGAKMHKTLPVEAPVRGRREMLHPAADVAPQGSSSSSSSLPATQLSDGATIGVKYSARIERMPGGDLGHLFTVREVMTNAIKETMVEGYRQCIYKKYRHGVPTQSTTSSSSSVATNSSSSAGLPVVHPVLVDLHMGQGTWDGQGITAVDVLHHVTGTTDTTAALRNLEEIVLQKATTKMGHFAILSDLHMTLRGGA